MNATIVPLGQLHRRFDGPIDDEMREAALSGRPRPANWVLLLASRDLDRLALSTVLAGARQRTAALARTGTRRDCDGITTALNDALVWYRAVGVRTIEARDALNTPQRAQR